MQLWPVDFRRRLVSSLIFPTAEVEADGHGERCPSAREYVDGVAAAASRSRIANDLEREVFVVLTSIEDRRGKDLDFVISPRRGSFAEAQEAKRDAREDPSTSLGLGAVPASAEMRLLRCDEEWTAKSKLAGEARNTDVDFERSPLRCPSALRPPNVVDEDVPEDAWD